MLDEKDLKILSILIANSRTSYVDIAKEVGISDVAIIKRIKKLESLGVIRRYTVIVDPKKLGFGSISFTGIDIDPQYLYDVISELKGREYVKYLFLTSGDHALITVIWAKDSDEMAKIHKEISSLSGVKRVCPSILLDIIKE